MAHAFMTNGTPVVRAAARLDAFFDVDHYGPCPKCGEPALVSGTLLNEENARAYKCEKCQEVISKHKVTGEVTTDEPATALFRAWIAERPKEAIPAKPFVPKPIAETETEALEPIVYDVRTMPWGDSLSVPTSGKNLMVIGTGTDGRLHIRIFDEAGKQVVDTDETKLPSTQATSTSALKSKLPGLMPPHVLSDAEKSGLSQDAASIVGHPTTRRATPAKLAADKHATGNPIATGAFTSPPEAGTASSVQALSAPK